MSMVFYLKVNRTETYSCRNLQNWLEIAQAYGNAKVYIQCDNTVLKEMIFSNTNIRQMEMNISFIETCWDDGELTEIVSNIANDRWSKAAYAHLTTFFHARENGYERFWNIDADDTCFCLTSVHTAHCLKEVENHAKKNDISLFSLDMHYSDSFGKHWTYGITYTNMAVDWLGYMKKHARDKEFIDISVGNVNKNIDWYTTYLRSLNDYGIETWYVNNLKFIHYSEDFFKRPANSGMRYWKEGSLIFPVIAYGYGMQDIGILPIPKDCICIREMVEDGEAGEFLVAHAQADDRKVMEFWKNQRGD